jgi:hypothetical protein
MPDGGSGYRLLRQPGEIEDYLEVDPDFPVMPAPDNADDVLLFLELYQPAIVEITNGSNGADSIAAIHAPARECSWTPWAPATCLFISACWTGG